MDKKNAKKTLEELRDSISEILGNGPPEDLKEKSIEFRDSAKDDKASFFQKMLSKAKELPVIDTFSQLGVAGSVAVTSAAVTQTDLAKDVTEVFIAEISNDVIEQRIDPPAFIDDWVDFHELNDWGEIVIAEKFIEAQSYAENVSEQIQSKIETGEIKVTKPSNVSSVSSEGSNSSRPNNTLEQKSEPKVEAKQEAVEQNEKSSNKEVKVESDAKQEPKGTEESKENKVSKEAEDVKEQTKTPVESSNESNESTNQGEEKRSW